MRCWKDKENILEKTLQFEVKPCMVQAFSCIDGTHISIKIPCKDLQNYFNSKNFLSLDVKAVCDYKGVVNKCRMKLNSATHDAIVFSNSSISHKYIKFPTVPRCFLFGYDKIPIYLIRDPT